MGLREFELALRKQVRTSSDLLSSGLFFDIFDQ